MAYDVGADPRLDPRVKAFLAYLGPAEPEGDVDSRETLLAEANSEEARAGIARLRRLFELEVTEIADGTVKIEAFAREPGYRTKIAVSTADQKVDPVGACVGEHVNPEVLIRRVTDG